MSPRPFANTPTADLVKRARDAAARRPTDFDTLLHCWAEAKFRHRSLKTLMALRAQFDNVTFPRPQRFQSTSIEPPDWYLDAYAAARSLPRGRSLKKNRRVYVLLLRGPPGARDDELGLYVGESYLTAEARLEQHLAGVHAAGVVKKRGIGTLLSFCPHLEHLSQYHSRRLEAELAARLRNVFEAHGLPPKRVQGGH